jgi:hypothetical protein
MDDFSKYEGLRETGASPKDVYRIAKADGVDAITVMLILRKVFALSFTEVKELTLIAERTSNSLDEFQEKLVGGLEQAFAHEKDDRSVNGAPTELAERNDAGLLEPFSKKSHE